MSRRRKKKLELGAAFPLFKPQAAKGHEALIPEDEITPKLFAVTVEAAAAFYREPPRTFKMNQRQGFAIFPNHGSSRGWIPRYWYDGNRFTLAWLNFRVRFQKEPRHFWFLWSRADDFEEFLP